MARDVTGGAASSLDPGQPSPVAPEETPGQRGRLLVVDDDPCLREAVALVLRESGYACATSENAVVALEHLERDRFDLIVTDLHMPDMDGMTLLELVKRRWSQTKVMIVTGDTNGAMKSQAIASGADSYLVKPFSLEQLMQEIEACLMGHRSRQKNQPAAVTTMTVCCWPRKKRGSPTGGRSANK